MEKIKLGLIRGAGTGKELLQILKKTINNLNFPFKIIENDYEFASYHELRKESCEEIKKRVEKDLDMLEKTYLNYYKKGVRVVFRTAINAETLYAFREKYWGIKILEFSKGIHKLLMIRDQSQGYYANTNIKLNSKNITFSGNFSKNKFWHILDFSNKIANNFMGKKYDCWVVYKHHLFGNLIEKWTKEFNSSIKVYQPNSATDILFRNYFDSCFFDEIKGENLLLVTGNEVGDIFHEFLLYLLKTGRRTTLHSKNIYLNPQIYGMVEFQTVHGSVDDLAGKNLVNPLGTLSALSSILKESGLLEYSILLNQSIRLAIKEGQVTPDMGGKMKTKEVIDFIIQKMEQLIK